jgi:hypothetical protein
VRNGNRMSRGGAETAEDRASASRDAGGMRTPRSSLSGLWMESRVQIPRLRSG